MSQDPPKDDPADKDLNKVAKKAFPRKVVRESEALFEKADELGVDPFTILLQIADGNAAALDLPDEKTISPELRAMAARECIRYMYPTKKAMEVTGKNGEAIEHKLSIVDKIMENLS